MQVKNRKIYISAENNIIEARRVIRNIAAEMGFGVTDLTRIITATSELVRNIYQHAGKGYFTYTEIESEGKIGLEFTFVDNGPGIPDLEQAFEDGFSTGKGLGLGLQGAKKMMDEMEITSTPGKGTRIIIRKWIR
jgi:serine/threonine-protein kinase RsbT